MKISLFSLKEKKIMLPDLRRIFIACIIIGIALRVIACFTINAGYDAGYFSTLGRSFSEGKGLYYPFGNPNTDSMEPVHIGTLNKQLFSMYLGMFYGAFGFSYFVSKAAVLILSFITLLVLYFCTKNLYGKDNAIIVTGIFSLDPTLIYTVGTIYSENLILLLLALALWGILKSFKNPKFLPVGMLFLSLFFISRYYVMFLYIASVCLFFIWLYIFNKGKIFKNIWFPISLVVVFIFILVNYLYEKSVAVSKGSGTNLGLVSIFLGNPGEYLIPFFILFVACTAFTIGYCLFFIKPIRKSLNLWKSPSNNFLWLVVLALIFFISIVFTVISTGSTMRLVSKDVRRYLTLIILPIVWIAIANYNYDINSSLIINFKHLFNKIFLFLKSRENFFGLILIAIGLLIRQIWFLFILILSYFSLLFKSSKNKLLVLIIFLLFVSINESTRIRYSYTRDLGIDLNEIVVDGDIIAVDAIEYPDGNGTVDRYFLAPYVEARYELVDYQTNTTADYIVSTHPDKVYDNYTVVKKYHSYDEQGIFTVIVKIILNQMDRPRIPHYILWERS